VQDKTRVHDSVGRQNTSSVKAPPSTADAVGCRCQEAGREMQQRLTRDNYTGAE